MKFSRNIFLKVPRYTNILFDGSIEIFFFRYTFLKQGKIGFQIFNIILFVVFSVKKKMFRLRTWYFRANNMVFIDVLYNNQ